MIDKTFSHPCIKFLENITNSLFGRYSKGQFFFGDTRYNGCEKHLKMCSKYGVIGHMAMQMRTSHAHAQGNVILLDARNFTGCTLN